MSLKAYVVFENDVLPLESSLISQDFRNRIIVGESMERGLLPFDVVEASGTVCFALNRHLDRFYSALNFCMIKPPIDQPKLKEFITKALKSAGLPKSLVRIDVVLGEEGRGRKPGLIIKIRPRKEDHMFFLKTYEYFRNMPSIKVAGGYAHAQIQKRLFPGHDDVLYIHPHDKVCTETSRGNFFAVKYSKDKCIIYGAASSEYILNGITRQFILNILDNHQSYTFNDSLVLEDALPEKMLNIIDEAFVASSGVRIAPVKSIDNFSYDTGIDGRGGRFTHIISYLFNNFVEDYYRTHSFSDKNSGR